MHRAIVTICLGVAITLGSTFLGERMAPAHYPEIMGCEQGCQVVATGWPFIFVRDYLGMSVGNRADILDVWLGADRFDLAPFLVNVLCWSALWTLGWQFGRGAVSNARRVNITRRQDNHDA